MKMQHADIAPAVCAINDIERWSSVGVSRVAFDSRHLQQRRLFIPLTVDNDGRASIQSLCPVF